MSTRSVLITAAFSTSAACGTAGYPAPDTGHHLYDSESDVTLAKRGEPSLSMQCNDGRVRGSKNGVGSTAENRGIVRGGAAEINLTVYPDAAVGPEGVQGAYCTINSTGSKGQQIGSTVVCRSDDDQPTAVVFFSSGLVTVANGTFYGRDGKKLRAETVVADQPEDPGENWRLKPKKIDTSYLLCTARPGIGGKL